MATGRRICALLLLLHPCSQVLLLLLLLGVPAKDDLFDGGQAALRGKVPAALVAVAEAGCIRATVRVFRGGNIFEVKGFRVDMGWCGAVHMAAHP